MKDISGNEFAANAAYRFILPASMIFIDIRFVLCYHINNKNHYYYCGR